MQTNDNHSHLKQAASASAPMTSRISKQALPSSAHPAWQWLQSSRDGFFMGLIGVNLLFLYLVNRELFTLIVQSLSDAYLNVSVFVALTLAGFHLLDRYFKEGVVRALNRRTPWQIPSAALLGALPGCGGAIIVVTQFVHGRVSFGALVTVLIATMGDAAFLLLARKPSVALLVFAVAMAAAIVTGFVVNRIHRWDDFKVRAAPREALPEGALGVPAGLRKAFWWLLAPGAVMGVFVALRADEVLWGFFGLDAAIGTWFGFAGAMLCLAIWFSQPMNSWTARFARKPESSCPLESTVAETSFVSVWVMLGFLSYELLVHFSGLDLHELFLGLGALTPLLAAAIGFIPGCGPQIVVTTLYINGVVPLSAQLTNAISNDGDALFPAIALAPRAAIVATLYSAVPALLLGYGAFWLGY